MVGGIPHSGESYFDGRWHEQGYDPVYVDEDGIVQKGKDRNWRREKEIFHYYRESDTVEYHKLNGAWFRVEIAHEDKERRWQGWGGYWHTRGYTYYYPLSKKALSKKEIKKLRLNDRTETIAPKLTLEEKDGDNRTDR
jgi:hypothetical protein